MFVETKRGKAQRKHGSIVPDVELCMAVGDEDPSLILLFSLGQ